MQATMALLLVKNPNLNDERGTGRRLVEPISREERNNYGYLGRPGGNLSAVCRVTVAEQRLYRVRSAG
jgi:hypothetical protein